MSDPSLLVVAPIPAPADGGRDDEGAGIDTAMLLRTIEKLEARMLTSIKVSLIQIELASIRALANI